MPEKFHIVTLCSMDMDVILIHPYSNVDIQGTGLAILQYLDTRTYTYI